jgi:hypothetical protein
LIAGVQLLVALTSIFSVCGKRLVWLVSLRDCQIEHQLHPFADAFRFHN